MKYILFSMIFIAALLVACRTETDDQPTPTSPSPSNSEPPSGYPAPTAVTGYPGQDSGLPSISEPENYPGPATPPPTIDPYPAGMLIWITHPFGEQCADGLIYPDSESASTTLEAAGVKVLDIEMIDLIVCAACGCPTSEHHRVQIDAGDMFKAEALGWTKE